MDTRLTDIIVCPVCKGPLRKPVGREELHCAKCGLGFRIVNDIPVMIAEEARHLSEEEIKAARIKPTEN